MGLIASKKHRGVYTNALKDGDIAYFIKYTDPISKQYRSEKIGLKSQGITEQYAYNKRSERLNQLRLGENPLKKMKLQILFDSLAQNYFVELERSSKSPASIKNEIGRYNLHIKPVLGNKNAFSITSDDINELKYLKYQEGKSDTTVKHIVTLISTIFNYAIKSEVYDGKNPCVSLKVKKIKLNNARERFLDKGEVEILLNDERIQAKPLLDRYVRMALSTGARLGTILDIQKKDINVGTRTVVLKNLKTNSIYHGFLNEQLFPDLEFLKGMKPNDYVVSVSGAKTEQTRVQHQLKPILDLLFNEGLDKKDSRNRVVVHTLRHSFASILAMNGTPMYRIQKLLDHKDPTMTQRYAKLSPDSSFEAVNSMFT